MNREFFFALTNALLNRHSYTKRCRLLEFLFQEKLIKKIYQTQEFCIVAVVTPPTCSTSDRKCLEVMIDFCGFYYFNGFISTYLGIIKKYLPVFCVVMESAISYPCVFKKKNTGLTNATNIMKICIFIMK